MKKSIYFKLMKRQKNCHSHLNCCVPTNTCIWFILVTPTDTVPCFRWLNLKVMHSILSPFCQYLLQFSILLSLEKNLRFSQIYFCWSLHSKMSLIYTLYYCLYNFKFCVPVFDNNIHFYKASLKHVLYNKLVS